MRLSLTLVSFLLFFQTVRPQVSFTQAAGSPFTLASMMRGAVAGDVNGDGIKDVLVATASAVYVNLGTGSGQFQQAPGSPISISGQPLYIVISNFNGDAFPDIATANYNGGSISVYLGNGTGSFAQAAGSPIMIGGQPYCVDAADFNMDGNLDIITSAVTSNGIYVLLGNGSGGFSFAPGFPINANGPYHVVAAKFNSDNFYDFAFVNGSGNTLQVYLGNGAGGFTQASGSPYSTGSQPRTIAVKDINNDAISDLVIPNINSNNLTIMMGLANGSFSASIGSPVTAGTNPYQAVIADFTLDGIQDIGFTNAGSNNFIIKAGQGNGNFTLSATYPLGSMPQPICSADFNGDAKPDVAIGDWLGSDMNVLINNSVGCALTASFNYTANTSGLVQFNSVVSGTTSTTTYSWNFGNGNGGSGSATSYTFLPGTYTVTLMVNNTSPNCSATVTQTITVPQKTGLASIHQGSFRMYPNPTAGYITLQTLADETVLLNIYTLSGQLVKSIAAETNKDIPLEVSNGVYICEITGAARHVFTKLIVAR
jgi:hypothetical protein